MCILPSAIPVMPSKVPLAFFAAQAHSWLMSKFFLPWPQDLFWKAVFYQPVLMLGVFLPQCRIWPFPLLIFMRFLLTHSCILSRSFWMTTHPFWLSIHSTQFCIVCKVAESILCPVRVAHEDVKQHWPLGYTSSDWPPAKYCAAIHNPFSPPHRPLVQRILSQLLCEDLMRNSVESLVYEVLCDFESRGKIKINNISHYSLVHWVSNFVVEVYQGEEHLPVFGSGSGPLKETRVRQHFKSKNSLFLLIFFFFLSFFQPT